MDSSGELPGTALLRAVGTQIEKATLALKYVQRGDARERLAALAFLDLVDPVFRHHHPERSC
jgi:hypothetical protein